MQTIEIHEWEKKQFELELEQTSRYTLKQEITITITDKKFCLTHCKHLTPFFARNEFIIFGQIIYNLLNNLR